MKKSVLFYTNIAVCVVILLGFAASYFISHSSVVKMLEDDIEKLSEMTSENIYSKIEQMLGRPINVSLAMSHNTFLRHWILNEEAHLGDLEYIEELKEHLLTYKSKYGFDSVTIVSAKSLRYYNYEGIKRVMSADNPEDAWYFDFMSEDTDYKLNIDNDKINSYTVTVFIDSKIKDDEGKVAGIVGIGLKTDYIQETLKYYEENLNIRAYLTDLNGDLQISSNNTKLEGTGLPQKMSDTLLEEIKNTGELSEKAYWNPEGANNVYYIIRYIPSLQWYLVVEKDTADITSSLEKQFYKKVSVILFIAIMVMLIITNTLKKYDNFIVNLANKDSLTGVRNRMAYEKMMKVYGRKLKTYSHFGIGVFDLNDLKAVNDTAGHDAGDDCIKNSSDLICASFPYSPIFRIGGDEFIAIFENIDETTVNGLWEDMTANVGKFNEEHGAKISIAFGYSFYDPQEDRTAESIFARADKNMYVNKEKMKGETGGQCPPLQNP